MGRPPKVRESVTVAEPVPEHVTYRPGVEDPVKTTWCGVVFHANAPKLISDPKLLAMARANRFFKVGPFDPATDAVPTAEQIPSPKTSDQYRAHALAWLKTMNSVDRLDTRWAAEETLRMECEVGLDDLDYLQQFFAPKREDLRRRVMAD